ncbi:hypothetical protein PAPHI01_1294 [Pancytospora philotis]|nr:hypothetical protein PAPHI01_1294 [Pancytospora philotis]
MFERSKDCTEQEAEHEHRPDRAGSSEKEEGEVSMPFLLCNADGTPIMAGFDSDSEEESRETLQSAEAETSKETAPSTETEASEPGDALAEAPEALSEQDVPATDSEEAQEAIDEFSRFMLIERLIEAFPAVCDSTVKARIAEILGNGKRTRIDFNLILKRKDGASVSEKMRALKEKKDTTMERVRAEFNRVTEDNMESVVNNLLAIKVKKVEEMKEVAMFVFEKAISEPVYLKLYIVVIRHLKKVWRSVEEESGSSKQTCFFGTLLRAIINKIASKHRWSKETEAEDLRGTRAEIEQQLEELETSRLFKKRQALGAVQLLLSLYDMNVIGPTNLVDVIENLTSAANTPENVEMIANIVKSTTLKLVENKKEDVVMKMINFLKTNDKKHGARIDFIIDSAVSHAKQSCPLLKTQRNGNTFASLMEDEPEEFESVEPTEEEIANDFVMELSRRISRDYDEKEMPKLAGSAKEFLAAHDNAAFFLAYFIELISNPKTGSVLSDIFFAHLSALPADLPASLRSLKAELGMLTIDFPVAGTRYAEFICFLRGADLIDAGLFDCLKSNEFGKKTEQLHNKWKENADPRLQTVFQ